MTMYPENVIFEFNMPDGIRFVLATDDKFPNEILEMSKEEINFFYEEYDKLSYLADKYEPILSLFPYYDLKAKLIIYRNKDVSSLLKVAAKEENEFIRTRLKRKIKELL